MKYSDLNLKIKKDTAIAKMADGKEVEVLQYLPIEDKIDLIQIALQKSKENGIYNELKLDMYFNLYIIYMYTNLEFTDEEKADEFKLYNELQSNDIIVRIIGAMDEDEYDNLVAYLNDMRKDYDVYNTSAAALLQTFIQDMPKNAAAAADIVDNFDENKYKRVVEFAKSANGNRPI